MSALDAVTLMASARHQRLKFGRFENCTSVLRGEAEDDHRSFQDTGHMEDALCVCVCVDNAALCF